MRKVYLLLVSATLLVQSAFSQSAPPAWKEAQAGGYKYRYIAGDPMQARFYTLSNGLTVILSVNKKDPRIQTLIGVRAGSNSDPATHTGLAHYLEHLLFKGTSQYGSLDWAKEKPLLDQIEKLYDTYNRTTDEAKRKAIYRQIDSVSGVAATFAIANEYDKMMTGMGAQNTNAHTWVEETVYQEDIPSTAIDKYLAVQAERFRDPQFRIFHTELEAVYEEKNRGLDNDGRKMYETTLTALFPTHNYGQQSTIGTIEHLKNPSLIEIRKFYNKYYVPNNMAIIFAGDFDPDYVIRKVDAAFRYMKPKPVTEYTGPKETPIAQPVVKEVFGPDAENISIAFRMPGAKDTRNSVLLNVVAYVLSNGKAGLLDLNLNQQQKLLRASISLYPWKDYAVFSLNGRAKQDQSLDEVRDLLLSQLTALRNGDFDASLIQAIVNNIKLDEIQGLESNETRANTLMDAFIKHRGQNWNYDVGMIDAMSKVTKKDITDFANQFLNNNYVLLYKRKGEDKNIVKVDKPPITPVAVNRDAQSDFLKKVAAMPETPVQPLWLDFQKDIVKGKAGPADLLYVQNKDNSLFRLHYRFDMGNFSDRQLAVALEYLKLAGTDKYASEEISKQFYQIACNFSVNVENEETTVTLSGLQENFDKAVELFDHLLTNCKADETVLAALKSRLLKSRADNKLNKTAILRGLRSYATYGAKNPFNLQITNDELKGLTASGLVQQLHDLAGYRHSVIYYGPAALNDVSASVARLHKLPATFREPQPAAVFTRVANDGNKVLFADYDMVQAEVNWVRNTDIYDPARTAVIDLYNNYFGYGMGSIVFQTIRESKALAYSTYAFYASPNRKDDKYSMLAYVGSQADKINEAIGGMNELLTTLPESDKAFETARSSMRKGIETERITQDGIVFNYLGALKLGLDTDIRKSVYERAGQLTFSDLHKLHQQEVSGKPYTYCIVASEKRLSPDDLKQYGSVQKLTLEEIFGY